MKTHTQRQKVHPDVVLTNKANALLFHLHKSNPTWKTKDMLSQAVSLGLEVMAATYGRNPAICLLFAANDLEYVKWRGNRRVTSISKSLLSTMPAKVPANKKLVAWAA